MCSVNSQACVSHSILNNVKYKFGFVIDVTDLIVNDLLVLIKY